ncbi:MAG: DUF1638 domain-containing protein [Acidimicrobiales bacterium]
MSARDLSPKKAAPDAVPGRVVVIACGAIAAEVRTALRSTATAGAGIEVRTLPSLLHNRPALIAGEVARLAGQLQSEGRTVVVAYADCGTYGALDQICASLGIERLAGLHCYDVFAGAKVLEAIFAQEPGTYVLTDFLVRSFERTVVQELGLDRYPELWPDYFGNYRRVVWLAQRRTADLERRADAIAEMFSLPLEVIETGITGLSDELERLSSGAGA